MAASSKGEKGLLRNDTTAAAPAAVGDVEACHVSYHQVLRTP